MKNIYIDSKKSLGTCLFMGRTEKLEYINKVKTGKVLGYSYKLGSALQGTEVVIYVDGDLREFQFGETVEIIDAVLNVSATANNNFANMKFSLSAEDIKSTSSNSNKVFNDSKKFEERKDDKDKKTI